MPRWLDQRPVNPEARKSIFGEDDYTGARGLAGDVRYYGRIIRARAAEKIGHLYPRVKLPKEYRGREADVVAWIWARTVASPDPSAAGAHVPLVRSFWLSSKKGNLAWLQPVVNRKNHRWRFDVHTGEPADGDEVKAGTKVGRGGFRCLLTKAPIPFDHVRQEGIAGRMGMRLLAIVASAGRGRVYLPPSPEQETAAVVSPPEGELDTHLPEDALGFRVQNYGFRRHCQLFTPRQLVVMVTLSDLVRAVRQQIADDPRASGLPSSDADEYARTVATALALALDRCADFNCGLSTWKPSGQQQMHLFTRQAIPMVWDLAEANLLGGKAICWQNAVDIAADAIATFSHADAWRGHARQLDAAASWNGIEGLLISTDPPYYDNIGYAALSDFFYVWLRRTVGDLHPELFSTILVPKGPELTAAPEQFDGEKEKAKQHFESGFRRAFAVLREKMDPRFPLTVYYAFKQKDEEAEDDEGDGRVPNGIDRTTGWETLLEALLGTGFQITATWPVRASQAWRMRAMGSNALASYIVLACRPQEASAPLTTRREFVTSLRRELPDALLHMMEANIAPVDLAQASIGPGMAIFSRYARVLEADGSPMSVRTALQIINQELDAHLAAQEGEMDGDTRFCVAWFEQYGMGEGAFGEADVLARAKNTSAQGLADAGVADSRAGKVRLLKRAELPAEWDPIRDQRLTTWEATQHLIRRLEEGGEEAAAALSARLGSWAANARSLAYRLYNICERKGWADEARAYNSLIVSWPSIQEKAAQQGSTEQARLDY